ALEWAPRVQVGRENEYRAATLRLLGRELTIVSLNGAKAVETSERAPVTYIEPLPGNEPALGLDLNSERIRREALAR
ncbi:CHASE domain-containing protein, partial [Acinetobacter baumannii]